MPRLIFSLLFALIIPTTAFAGWVGPETVVSGKWGDGEGEFGFRAGEEMGIFPRTYAVLDDGSVVVEDGENMRLVLYDQYGKCTKSLRATGIGLFNVKGNYVLSGKLDNYFNTKIGMYDVISEKWIWVDDDSDFGYFPNLSIYFHENTGNIYVWNNIDSGIEYDLHGNVVKLFKKKPDEIPSVFSNVMRGDNPNLIDTKLDFDGISKVFSTKYGIERIDYFGKYIYASTHIDKNFISIPLIYKISRCGEIVSEINLSNGVSILKSNNGRGSDRLEEFGEPYVSKGGDIFMWKRTIDTYSILKWKWVDDTDGPKDDCSK